MPPRNIGPNILSWLPEEQIEESALNRSETWPGCLSLYEHVAVMPDCHYGLGATVGSCIPTLRAIIPAAVGVDIGCGMIAVKTPLTQADLPEDLSDIRKAVEEQIPLSRAGTIGASKRPQSFASNRWKPRPRSWTGSTSTTK